MSAWCLLVRVPVLGWGLGLVAGGFEAVKLGATLQLSVGFGEALLMALACVLLGGLLGAVAALLPAALVSLPRFRGFAPRQNALGMALTGAALGWWYLLPAAAVKLDQGIVVAALAFAAMPVGVGGVVWYNARYWLLREDIGDERRLGWWFFAPLGGLALSLIAAAWLSSADQGSGRAILTDPAVVLITVDGLDMATLEDETGPATPTLDTLAAEGIVYQNAVTPSAELGPAAAALLTARHPLRAGVVGSGDRLARPYETLPEVLRGQEGYATAAFVSSPALARGLGFEQGFAVYDDVRLPGPAGLQENLLVAGLERLLLLAGHHPAAWRHREDAASLDRAGAWIRARSDRPLFAWVQLSGPRIAADQPRAVAELDAALGPFLEGVRDGLGERPLIVLVAGTGGRTVTGLSDQSLRVPLISVPHKVSARRTVIPEQVRLMDVAPTVLDLLRLDPLEHAEGAELTGFAEGVKDRDYACLLVGWEAAGPVFGYRARNGGGDGQVKFTIDPRTDQRRLFALSTDPEEQSDLAPEQREAVDQLALRVRQEAGPLWTELPPATGPAWVVQLLRDGPGSQPSAALR
jgi:hypothetical protein